MPAAHSRRAGRRSVPAICATEWMIPPADGDFGGLGYPDDEIDAVIDDPDALPAKMAALPAHATQLTVGPTGRALALSNNLALPDRRRRSTTFWPRASPEIAMSAAGRPICSPDSTSRCRSRGRLPTRQPGRRWIRIWTRTSSTGRTDWTASSGCSCPSFRSWTASRPDRQPSRAPARWTTPRDGSRCPNRRFDVARGRRSHFRSRRRSAFALLYRLGPISDQRIDQWPAQRGVGVGGRTMDHIGPSGRAAAVDLVADRRC